MDRMTVRLTPTPPYDFELTASDATYFRGHYGAESFQDGVFQRLMGVDSGRYLATVRSLGTVESPCLEAKLVGDTMDEEALGRAQHQLAWILGTCQDLAPFYCLALGDPMLNPLALALRGLHVPHTASVYEALIWAILGQQISSHVAHMLRNLLIQTYGPSVEVVGVPYHAFPRPETLVAAGVEGLRAIKFSGRKAEYIVDISSMVASRQLDLEGLRSLPDDEVINTLTGIRGVGPWTAHWLMIRAFGRADGFPHGDLALQRVLGQLVNGGTPLGSEEALEYSLRWAPFRSYVTTYLFAAIRSGAFASVFPPTEVGP